MKNGKESVQIKMWLVYKKMVHWNEHLLGKTKYIIVAKIWRNDDNIKDQALELRRIY